MPERLDHVTVTVPMGIQTISWDAREVLLASLEQKEMVAELDSEALDVGIESSAAAIRASFEAVGASRPVELRANERLLLCVLLKYWDVPPDGVSDVIQTELLALLTALERGEPWEGILEDWEEGDGSTWRWRWEQWNERPRPDDHLHCLFCNTRFSDRTAVDDDLAEGWCSLDEDDYERWVCAGCFEKLHERFGWKVERPPAS